MAKRRIGSIPKKGKKTKEPAQRTTLWNFFGRFWKGLAEQEQQRAQLSSEVHEIEELAFLQITGKHQQQKLRLKK